jgi:pimeloyl-ACP methyl ester carboxylesterase
VAKVAALKSKHRTGTLADRVADIEVYLDAVRRPLKYDERLYAPKDSTPVATALQTLAKGAERAEQLARGETPWMNVSGVRGFYSRIDGSAQPYILTLPDNYDPAAARKYRLDLFLHGRDDTVLEQQFMAKSMTGYASKPLGAGADRLMLQPYSRYTNASRFAGETDGLESIESVAKAYPIDRDRIVMAGFSMGGAAAWSFIVHYADRWVAGAPGAGFSETEVFLRAELAKQPQNAVQRTLWHMYDSTDYAVNTFNVPVVAYSGGIDAQKQAADAMAAAMLDEGLTLEHIIGPETGHQYEPRARQQVQDRLDRIAAAGRNAVPKEIRFTTWMLRYNRMFWLTVDGLEAHWQRARVAARIADEPIVHLTTANVTALHLAFAKGQSPFAPGTKPSTDIDGQTVPLPPSRGTDRYRPASSRRRMDGRPASCRPAAFAKSTDCRARSTTRSWRASCSCGRAGRRCRRRSGAGRTSRLTTRSASGSTSSGANRVSGGTQRSARRTSPPTTSCSSGIHPATRSTSGSRPVFRFDGPPAGWSWATRATRPTTRRCSFSRTR